jgi:hypothetical protein
MNLLKSARGVYDELAETLTLEKARARSAGPDHDVAMMAFLAGGHQFRVTGIGFKEHELILLWEPRQDGNGTRTVPVRQATSSGGPLLDLDHVRAGRPASSARRRLFVLPSGKRPLPRLPA